MKTSTLTLQDVKKALAPYGIKVSRTRDREFVIRYDYREDGKFYGEYFTTDIRDAFMTGFSIASALGH